MKLSNLSPSFCCFLLFFSISAFSDLRRKKIPRWIFWLFLPPGLISFLLSLLPPEKGGSLSLLLLPLSLLPGFLLLLLSHFSRSALGRGDAVFFLISALYLPLRSLLFLLFSAVLVSGLVGAMLLIRLRFQRRSARSLRFPFLPCLLPGLLLLTAISLFPSAF